MSKKMTIPAILTYARSLSPSDARMMAVNEAGNSVRPILIHSRGLRGTMSNFTERKEAEKVNGDSEGKKDTSRGNLQHVYEARMPADHDFLRISFGLSINGGSQAPDSFKNSHPETINTIRKISKFYAEQGGYQELAQRYLSNIVSGAFMWRNLTLTDAVNIKITRVANGKEETAPLYKEAVVLSEGKEIAQDHPLVTMVADALMAPMGNLHLKVEAEAFVGGDMEVFPSQQLPYNEVKKGDIGRLLAHVLDDKGNKMAIIHGQKIGNALRTIDTWYDSSDNPMILDEQGRVRALPVEPFGVDRRADTAWRIANKTDLYTLIEEKMTGWADAIDAGKSLSNIDPNIHYFMACLVRGGVYNGNGKG